MTSQSRSLRSPRRPRLARFAFPAPSHTDVLAGESTGEDIDGARVVGSAFVHSAEDFTTTHFTKYRTDRLAGKFNREKAGSGRKKGEEAKPLVLIRCIMSWPTC